MNDVERLAAIASCRRCHRPLRSALAVAAGVGGRCALLDLAEAAGGPSRPVLGGATAEQTAIALVSAFLHHQDDQIMPLLRESDLTDVAGLMAALGALHLERLPEGEQLLREAALRVAQVGS